MAMAAVIFLCPNTGDRVQEWFADDGSGDSETYAAVTCLACRQVWSIRGPAKYWAPMKSKAGF